MVDNERSKLFVGGISSGIDENILKEYFSRYGEVSSSVIARDHNSRIPRGFGFVTFSDSASADKALTEIHKILDKVVDVKRAVPKNLQSPQKQRDNDRRCGCGNVDYQFRTRKIFVGGLSASVTQEEFRAYFANFGKITDVVVMHDNSTNRPRGFGFITFESEDVVDIVVQKHYYELGGKTVEVKRAVPKDSARHSSCNVHNKNGNGVVDDGSFSFDDYGKQQHQWAGDFRYGYYPGPGYYHHPWYNFNGYYGAMYPMGCYGPVRYANMATMPMIPSRGPWNDFGMARTTGSAPFYNMNGGVGVVSGASSVNVGKKVKGSEGIKQSDSAMGGNIGMANGHTLSIGEGQKAE